MNPITEKGISTSIELMMEKFKASQSEEYAFLACDFKVRRRQNEIDG